MTFGISHDKKAMEQFAAQLVGKSFKDEHGNDVGTVEKTWYDEKRSTVIAAIRLHEGKLMEIDALRG